jgi:SprT protein
METADVLSTQIRSFIPQDAVDIVVRWITDHGITLTITENRKSIFGDYRWPRQDKGHRISVNGDLNQYAFLITLVHEMAHLTTWEKFRNTVSSHGKEWKAEYKILMDEFTGRKIFPADIKMAFKEHLVSPNYSHCVDEQLMSLLKKHDKIPAIHIVDLPERSLFEFQGRIYQKGKKLRKRFRCIDMLTRREYFFSPIAEIKKMS